MGVCHLGGHARPLGNACGGRFVVGAFTGDDHCRGGRRRVDGQQSDDLKVLTVAGSLYLFWLGVGMLRNPATPVSGSVQVADSWSRWAWKGLCVSGLNPKVFLLFLALLPQFTDPLSTWPVPAQIVALGGLHAVSCGVVYLLVGFGARAVLQTRPGAAQRVSQTSGAIMILIALILLAEQML